jgi:NAD(P)-dependent dehydrogenase (short-subunit alcohol dehydrogenase family)
MDTERILIIGGSSGMGLALARLLLRDGAEVLIAGRSASKLALASGTLGEPRRLSTHQADVSREDDVQRLLSAAGPLHHIVITAADAAGTIAPAGEMPLADAQALIAAKVLGPWLVAKHAPARLRPGASLTYTGGIAAHRPSPGASMTAAANAALEGLARALALELAPIRINVVCPGWTDTPLWDVIAGDNKTQRLAAMASRLPAGRVGHPDDIARAHLAVIRNGFITGSVIHVDGGQQLV